MSIMRVYSSCGHYRLPSLQSTFQRRNTSNLLVRKLNFAGTLSKIRDSGSVYTRNNFSIKCSYSGNNMPGKLPKIPVPNNIPFWAKCLLGVIAALARPLWKICGAKFLAIGRQVDEIAEAIEDVAEVVEEVAECVEEAAEKASSKLPEDGLLKDVVNFVEDVSEDVARGARQTIRVMDKIEELEDRIETIVEQVNETKLQSEGPLLPMESRGDHDEEGGRTGDELVVPSREPVSPLQ